MGRLFRFKLSCAVILIGLGIFLVTLCFGFTTGTWPASSERILAGITVEGMDVGGMTAVEAEQALSQQLNELLEKHISFLYDDKSSKLSYRELGVSVPLHSLVEQALDYGQSGSLLQKIRQRWRLRHRGYNIPFSLQWDKEYIKNKVVLFAPDVNRPARNAALEFRGDQVVLTPAHTGRRLMVEETVNDLLKLMPLKGDGYVPVATKPVWPQVTTGDLRRKGITGLVAKYTTNFNPYNKPRTKNIRLAAANLDGTEIAPGQVFSFNETVGPRTEERGFQEALIIKNDDFVPGVGGGVCQVSSTLYNAALRANLAVRERRRHSLLITYVPLGMDATVAYGAIDFKFVNNTGRYLIIKTAVGQDSLTIRLFGRPQPVTVDLKSVVEKTFPYKTVIEEDGSIPAGKSFIEQKGIPGYRVRVEKRLIQNGKTISREIISRDMYPGQDKIIRIGTGAVE